MISVMYQNNRTGDTHDITTLTTGCIWKTSRDGSPSTVELELIADDDIQWELGSVIALQDDDLEEQGLFYGYVMKVAYSESQTVTATCYDQIYYLKKNKDTYVFENQTADQILSQICADFDLVTGQLSSTAYPIPIMVEDGQTLLDIVLKALDHTLINTSQMYVLYDNFGEITLQEVKENTLDLMLGDDSLATGYSYEEELEESYNKIKLVKDNKETGKRDLYVTQDSNNMTFWGTLQIYEKVDEELTEAQIKAKGDNMLEFYNRPKKAFTLDAIADRSVRAGKAIYIGISDIDVSSFFIVDECTHDLITDKMNLKLVVI